MTENKITIDDLPVKRIVKPTYQVNIFWKLIERSIDSWKESYGWEMNPDFQRGHVWTLQQKIRYIEYVLEGGYSGKDIYLNSANWEQGDPGVIQTIDGLQRLTAVRQFMNNDFKIYNKWRSKDFKTLRDLHCNFKIYVNSLASRHDVIKWYLELNSGGTPHTKEELKRVQGLLDKCAKHG